MGLSYSRLYILLLIDVQAALKAVSQSKFRTLVSVHDMSRCLKEPFVVRYRSLTLYSIAPYVRDLNMYDMRILPIVFCLHLFFL